MSKYDDWPPIYFYLPEADWLEDMPEDAKSYWEEFGRGIYCWTLQTYLHLTSDGFPCSLVGSMPDEGIVLAHRDSLKYELRPKEKVLIVCIKADQAAHPYAQMHVVQNPQEIEVVKNSHYIPLWSQPGLIPRDHDRGDRFENIAYFGISYNLAPELKDPSWSQSLAEMGLQWNIVPKERWHDYSDVDAVIAVRTFEASQTYLWKPATKLYNSWRAEVPVILGAESAFQAERRSDLDYIEVKSLEEAIAAIKTLKDNPQLRKDMIANGCDRAQATNIETILSSWKTFLTDIATPAYRRWLESPNLLKWIYIQQHYWSIKTEAIKKQLKSLTS
ncbi:hypothetical protein [Roseofilum sp. Guam]|uniref:hypothetical protein n=1 Tax=Roseofilum sp. Guam TaxID=2821502 RepID=UPI001B1FAA21|nr:hypothetical protein [Roseofilum sp. Guam]MBP0027329.1 hypothetical protein [Roseofilum sp. Guam]